MALCRHCLSILDPGKALCRRCGGWTSTDAGAIGVVSKAKTTTLDQVVAEKVARATVGPPWDECFGGGIVWTSSTLFGGAPGGGKTTALMQILSKLIDLTGKDGYYLSAEQGPGDLKITAERLKIPNIRQFRVLNEFGVGAEIDEGLLKEHPPAGMIVDSVSALCGKDVHAAIAIAKRFKIYAIKYKAPAFLICHMTKEHDYAGLMALQHEVDSLVTIFPEEDGSRHLKPWKNRYGPTHAEYKLLMTELGLIAAAPKEKKQKKLLGVGWSQPEADSIPLPVHLMGEKKSEKAAARSEPVVESIEVNGQVLVRKKKKFDGAAATADLTKAKKVKGKLEKVKGKLEKVKANPSKAKSEKTESNPSKVKPKKTNPPPLPHKAKEPSPSPRRVKV